MCISLPVAKFVPVKSISKAPTHGVPGISSTFICYRRSKSSIEVVGFYFHNPPYSLFV